MFDNGRLEAYVGAMGAGKTEKLVEIYKELLEEGVKVGVYKHVDSIRDEDDDVVTSRIGNSAPATAVYSIYDVSNDARIKGLQAVLIDEIQFFDEGELAVMLEGMAMLGMEVYVFGLDVTAENEPFGFMGDVLVHADQVHKLEAKCHVCGEVARISKYMGDDKDDEILVGDIGVYQPTCRRCYYEVSKQEEKLKRKIEVKLAGEGFYFYMATDIEEIESAGRSLDDLKGAKNVSEVADFIKDLYKSKQNE